MQGAGAGGKCTCLCVPTLQHLMTHLPFYHPGTVEITKHFGLAMLMVSAELADGQPD